MTIGSIANVSDDESVISQGDSAELRAYVFDDERLPFLPDDIASVSFTIQKPDGSRTTHPGTIEDDGGGFFRYLDTDDLGKYMWVAHFDMATGQRRSRRGVFVSIDPFEQVIPEDYMTVADEVWMRLEDIFSSEEGGPWLRDMTLAWFSKEKVPYFVKEALLLINYTPPITGLDIGFFVYVNPNLPLSGGAFDPNKNEDSFILVQATLIAVIKHLMRSYVEQPDQIGANIVRETMRDYLQRWQIVLKQEEEAFKSLLTLWKRQFLNFGHSSLLVHNKAGRVAAPGMRTRNVYRGGWM